MTKSILLTVTVLLGLCSLTAVAKSFKQQQDIALFYNIFKDWISKFNKQYGIEEMVVRYSNWKSNLDFVQEHNSKEEGFKLEMNHFADMTPEEFSALHLGLQLDLDARKKHTKKNTETNNAKSQNETSGNHTEGNQTKTNSTAANHTALPKSVDWRSARAVTGVKNQGKCGGCWSFSASGALEGLHAIKNMKLAAFSEQQMMDCSANYGNQGCDGGLMTNAFNYTKTHGIEPELGYEYTASVGTCKQNPQRVAFRNTGFEEVLANNATALKAAVSQQPVSVGIEASSLTVQLFKSGVITSGCGTGLDHGVLVVGYDTTSTGHGYWIVKNSWGPEWGLQGYFHVAMGSHNEGAGMCGINMMASYPTL